MDGQEAENRFEALCRQVNFLLDVKRFPEAYRKSQEVISLDPSDEYGYCLAARALLDDTSTPDHLSLALHHADEAIARNPANEWPYRLRSIILAGLGEKEAAIPVAEEAVSIDPESSLTLFNLANRCLDAGHFYKARRIARKLLHVAPQDAKTFEILGKIALTGQRWAEAEQWFRKNLQVDPESSYALANLGRVHHRQGRLGKAQAFYAAALKCDPENGYVKEWLNQDKDENDVASGFLIRFFFVGLIFGLPVFLISTLFLKAALILKIIFFLIVVIWGFLSLRSALDENVQPVHAILARRQRCTLILFSMVSAPILAFTKDHLPALYLLGIQMFLLALVISFANVYILKALGDLKLSEIWRLSSWNKNTMPELFPVRILDR